MNDIFVLRTNIKNDSEVTKLSEVLKELPKMHQITVDLEDKDKVLRIEGENLELSKIIEKVSQLGFYCEELN